MIISCPNCNKQFQVDDSAAGKQVRCTQCQRTFTISAPGAEAESPAQPAQAPAPVAPAPQVPLRAPGAGVRTPASGGLGGMLGATTVGKILLLAGLALVLFARGCDSIGNRGVARAKAKYDQAREEFNDEWERKLGRVSDFQERQKLQEEQRKQREALEKGDWADLKSASRSAAANNVMWSYWREWVFVFGTIVLAVGLVWLAFTTTGPERLVCLIMIAILTFSVYIGGLAWIASVFNSVMGGVSSTSILR